MITFLFAALTQTDKTAAVLTRYTNAMRAMPCFEVKSVYVMPKGASVTGDVLIDRNSRLFYRAIAKNADYTLTISPAGYRELDRVGKVYDEYPYRGNSYLVPSRITSIYRTLPEWLHSQKLQALLPNGTSYSYGGREQVAGVDCDRLHAKISNQMGNGTLDIDVAPTGLIAKYSAVMQSARGGRQESTWLLSDYRPSASFPQSRFVVAVPDGYMPFALAESFGPAAVGSKLKLFLWVNSKSKQGWATVPLIGSPQLVVVIGHDSVPGAKAAQEVRGWQSMLSGAGVSLLIVSDAKSAADAGGLLYDPTGQNLKAIDPPATPLFVLVDASRMVRNLWMGFDASGAGKLRSDVQAAIAGLKK